MVICPPRLLVFVAFDPVAVGAEELILACHASKCRIFHVFQDAIEMRKPHAMARPQFRAATSTNMVNLQGARVSAASRAVFVMPPTVGLLAAPSEFRQNLKTQVPLSYSALTFGHVYSIHSSDLFPSNFACVSQQTPGKGSSGSRSGVFAMLLKILWRRGGDSNPR
jgi:hypothetical protein